MPSPHDLSRSIHRQIQCQRYDAHGNRCTNTTRHHDGWCRVGNCPGYTRPIPVAHDNQRTLPSFPPNTEQSCPIDLDEVATIEISATAIHKFCDRHGVTRKSAETQIRSMMEDFILQRRFRHESDGWLRISHKGYMVVISADMQIVAEYITHHAERTYAQVRAGITSRYTARKQSRRRKRRKDQRVAMVHSAGGSITTHGGTIVITGPEGEFTGPPGQDIESLSRRDWWVTVARVNAATGLAISLPATP